jgi:aminomethyltransferase
MIDKGIPRHGYEIADEHGNKIGEVTSGTQAPSLAKAVALGYVAKEFSSIGSTVYIKIRDKLLSAQVVKFPFV